MKIKSYLLFSVASLMILPLVSCKPSSPNKEEENNVNIIMTAATIPPVMAALESIKNGDPTYAWIERGKTYSGMASTDFVNLGFDVNTNLAYGLIAGGDNAYDGYTPVVNKMKELKEENKNTHFSIYCTDYKVLSSVCAAFEAGLEEDKFTIYMVEDGSATYSNLRKLLITGKTNEMTDVLYDQYISNANNLYNECKRDYHVIRDNNTYFDQFVEGYPYTFALTLKSNFVHVLQSEAKFRNALGDNTGSNIGQAYLGTEGSRYQAHVRYQSISECYNALSETQKNKYLTLMLGEYKDEINAAVHRTTLDDGATRVPSKKLIYIGSRIRQYDLNGRVAPTFTYSDITSSYDSLDIKYKDVFSKEADYLAVYNFLNNSINYEDAWKNNNQVVQQILVSALNYYITYAWYLKFAYRMYGDTYDIIIKGHPGEVIDQPERWSYKVTVNNTEYSYNMFMNKLARVFHNTDSEGKFCKLIPNGVAAENLAYLDYDHVVGGISSSTYTGYDSNVPVLFMSDLNADTANERLFKNAQDDPILADRYEEGTLDGVCGEDEVYHTYYNKGNLYSALSTYYNELEENEMNTHFKEYYENLYKAFLRECVPEEEELLGWSFDRFGILEKTR